MGPGINDVKEIRILNRIVAWEQDGIRYEADQRHAEILANALNLQDAKGVETPGINITIDEALKERELRSSDVSLVGVEATAYRACAARSNFLGLDRPDMQFAAKEVSRHMSQPQESDIAALKRLARYCRRYPRIVFKYKFQAPPKSIKVYSDSNYAGCLKTRKSTQGGAILLGQHCVKTYSSTQGVIALSSAEAEFYGIVKAASVGLGSRAALCDLGCELPLTIFTDATAAQAMASRRGLGKPKHMDTQYLWIQERVNNNDFGLSKIPGSANPADLMTKHLDSGTMRRHMAALGLEVRDGRSVIAPSLGHLRLRGAGSLQAVSARLRPKGRAPKAPTRSRLPDSKAPETEWAQSGEFR